VAATSRRRDRGAFIFLARRVGKKVDGGIIWKTLGETLGKIIVKIIGKHCRNLLLGNGWSVLA
jgi:hypothetical protein